MASEADLKITKRIKEAGQTLEIQVLDHIIITENGYLSFQDEGIFWFFKPKVTKFFIDKIQIRAPYYNLLFKGKPGITSLGQVKYGYAQNVDEMIKRLHYDLNYIENMSFSMDIRIMIMTVVVMIQGRGK